MNIFEKSMLDQIHLPIKNISLNWIASYKNQLTSLYMTVTLIVKFHNELFTPEVSIGIIIVTIEH